MSFKEKLQKMRKERGYSQEQLADIIGVSRQAVSKWESGMSYPETEKLIELSKLFSMSLDELLKEEITEEKPVLDPLVEKKFIHFYKKFSLMISIGVFLCIMAIVATALVEDIFHSDVLEILSFFSFILVAVVIFVYYGIEFSRYEEVEKLYKQKMMKKPMLHETSRKFSVMMTIGVALCILGVILGGVASELTKLDSIQAIAFFGPISIAVCIFIYYGMENGLYYPENKKEKDAESPIYGVLMLIATIIFLLCGFLWNAWHPAWVVFPIGGILCGIVAIIIGEEK